MSNAFGLRISTAPLFASAPLAWLAAGPIAVHAEVLVVQGAYGVNPGDNGENMGISPPLSTMFAASTRYAATGLEGEGGRP